MAKTIKTVTVTLPTARNPYAVTANNRKAGRHVDRRKKANRQACRKGGWNE